MMRNSLKYVLFFVVFYFSTISIAQENEIVISKLTALNPVSYIDVTFLSDRDTVLVCTLSGRLAQRIKGDANEQHNAVLDDEIYVLVYNKERKQIAASTLENGIVIVHRETGRIEQKLSLIETWALRINYSSDNKYFFANDQRGNRFLWDVNLGYKRISLPDNFPKGSIIAIDNTICTVISTTEIVRWDLSKQQAIEVTKTNLSKFGDMDAHGNIINLRFNEGELLQKGTTNPIYKVKHPSWLRTLASIGGEEGAKRYGIKGHNGYFEDINFQMALTDAKFAGDKIYTSSIDRSLRVWDKKTGTLLESLTGHTATVNRLKVNVSGTQVVSIDLKGGLFFWETNEKRARIN